MAAPSDVIRQREDMLQRLTVVTQRHVHRLRTRLVAPGLQQELARLRLSAQRLCRRSHAAQLTIDEDGQQVVLGGVRHQRLLNLHLQNGRVLVVGTNGLRPVRTLLVVCPVYRTHRSRTDCRLGIAGVLGLIAIAIAVAVAAASPEEEGEQQQTHPPAPPYKGGAQNKAQYEGTRI